MDMEQVIERTAISECLAILNKTRHNIDFEMQDLKDGIDIIEGFNKLLHENMLENLNKINKQLEVAIKKIEDKRNAVGE